MSTVQIITVAGADDLERARELFLEYEQDLPFDLSFQDFQDELAALPGRYAPPDGALFLAHHDGHPVGCVALRRIGEGICEMKRLFVQPAFRGQGIGRALAEAIIEKAQRIRYKRMRLDTILEPAKSLYESLGFREIPPYEDVPVEGVMFMELKL
jgi:GNAT superfamily N-acetyltransferase